VGHCSWCPNPASSRRAKKTVGAHWRTKSGGGTNWGKGTFHHTCTKLAGSWGAMSEEGGVQSSPGRERRRGLVWSADPSFPLHNKEKGNGLQTNPGKKTTKSRVVDGGVAAEGSGAVFQSLGKELAWLWQPTERKHRENKRTQWRDQRDDMSERAIRDC